MKEARSFIPLLIFAVGFLAVSILSVLTVVLFSDRMIDSQIESIQAILETKHRQVETFLIERAMDANVMAARQDIVQFLSQRQTDKGILQSEIRSDAVIFAETYKYSNMMVLNPQGHLLISATNAVLDPRVAASAKRAMETSAPAGVDFHQTADNRPVFGLVQPVFVGSGAARRVVGAVYIEVDAEKQLYPLLADWPVASQSAETIIIGRDGAKPIHLSPLRHQGQAPQPQPRVTGLMHTLDHVLNEMPMSSVQPLAEVALSAPERVSIHAVDYRGVHVLAASRGVYRTPWVLLAKIDEDEVLRAVRNLQLAAVVIGFSFVILLAGLSFTVWRLQRNELKLQHTRMQARYSAAMSNSIDAYVVIDLNGRFVEVNNAAVNRLGYSTREFESMNIHDLDVGLTAGDVARAMEVTREHGRGRVLTKWRRKDDHVIDIDLSISFVENGTSGGLLYASARDITDELLVRMRLERLNLVYMLLADANEHLRNLTDQKAIFEGICKSAVEAGKFKLVLAAVVDEARINVRPVAAFGAAASYAMNLEITLPPELPTSQGPTGRAIRERHVVFCNDFLNDPTTAAWHGLARIHGINASAAVPIVVNDEAIAAIMFYSDQVGFFDTEVIGVLVQIVSNVSFALESAMFEERAAMSEGVALRRERQYRAIFESSPLALQIISLQSGKILSLNRAHRDLFGYELADIPDQDAWLKNVFRDETRREQITELWLSDVAKARTTGLPVSSPELSLHRKDGQTRYVIGKVTVVDEDIIVAWTDVTDRHEQMQILRENEARFRGLIEQTITGIYVVRDHKLRYVNPRFEEICGYHSDELLGRDSRTLIADEALTDFDKLRTVADHGQTSVDAHLKYRRKDGQVIDVDMHAARSSWDGEPALIVMVQDVSQQMRAEEKIASYVLQLQEAMQGTLAAVSKMVDFRDPYTAGHERRVGLISAAIGKEMGLPAERCNWLEWAGMVHDIGKIAIPAELLAKPTRLTPTEYEMIKGHAEAGYEILKDVKFPVPVAEIARQHHERMDGSGYPRGLKGDAILLEARILAVADVLESMASHRPYRPGLGVDAALAELEAHRGMHYDPAAVDALLRLVREKDWHLPK